MPKCDRKNKEYKYQQLDLKFVKAHKVDQTLQPMFNSYEYVHFLLRVV